VSLRKSLLHSQLHRITRILPSVGILHAIRVRVSTILAIPVWNNQLSTTFDFAGKLLIVEAEAGREIARKEVQLKDEAVEKKARRIRDLAVQVLLCGAVSHPLARAVSRVGIQVIPYVSGPVDNVLAAYLCGRLAEPRFLQPGCRPGARRRWRNRGGFCGGRGKL